ncbi:hypothetical protein [Bacillus licheniformis]|uniref:hypothetical protein n=1 Tax=Bacillus licheniformis TaxID=1402 RepID=UPI002282FFCA|nr:hypothetical protein [Bacillus licheniformis]MCY9266428.1 hypothetical protein [Bacillus licheniformis]MEC0794205.1 hypothetical protein [Bacillus licheniformis]
MADQFLNESNGVYTSSRDNGQGQPITDVHVLSMAGGLIPSRVISETYLENTTVKAGESVYLNIDAKGNGLGVGIYTNEKGSLTVKLTYIIPGTSNYTIKEYEDVLTLENNDRGLKKIEVLSSSPRIMITNTGEADVSIKSLVITHFS